MIEPNDKKKTSRILILWLFIWLLLIAFFITVLILIFNIPNYISNHGGL
jgi:flagellar basal body-associated protein FliL